MSGIGRRVGLAAFVFVFAACEDSVGAVTQLPVTASPWIFDGPPAGIPQFHWLSPIVASPSYGGVFDPTAPVLVDISEYPSNGPPRFVTNFMTGGTTGRRVAVESPT